MATAPWVETYRPQHLEDIVLDAANRRILQSIVAKRMFPHLLLHGPPGTGKTTTAINLIRAYQLAELQRTVPDLVIHLNASDERGIDVVRSQINAFAQAKHLFQGGTKFVILDEVDYMTKTAQQALRCLLQQQQQQPGSSQVRFCLICNYVSKIDDGLRCELVSMRFNQLPPADIVRFLATIASKEELAVGEDVLRQIQTRFQSDVRSMINFLQSNHQSLHPRPVLGPEVWSTLVQRVESRNKLTRPLLAEWQAAFEEVCNTYEMELVTALHRLLAHVLSTQERLLQRPDFLKSMEWILHAPLPNPHHAVNYVLVQLHTELTTGK